MYFKIIKNNLKHYDMQYKKILILKFYHLVHAKHVTMDCLSDEKHILEISDYGDKLAAVLVTDEDLIVQ